jgi:hypothetical protein
VADETVEELKSLNMRLKVVRDEQRDSALARLHLYKDGQARAAEELAGRLAVDLATMAEETAAVVAAVRLGSLLRAAVDGDGGRILDELNGMDADEAAALVLAAETLVEVGREALAGRRR